MPFTAEEVLVAAVCGAIEGRHKRIVSEEERLAVVDTVRRLLERPKAQRHEMTGPAR